MQKAPSPFKQRSHSPRTYPELWYAGEILSWLNLIFISENKKNNKKQNISQNTNRLSTLEAKNTHKASTTRYLHTPFITEEVLSNQPMSKLVKGNSFKAACSLVATVSTLKGALKINCTFTW